MTCFPEMSCFDTRSPTSMLNLRPFEYAVSALQLRLTVEEEETHAERTKNAGPVPAENALLTSSSCKLTSSVQVAQRYEGTCEGRYVVSGGLVDELEVIEVGD